MNYLIIYITLINIISFILMYYDKRKSIKHEWRVPELRLIFFACILGSPGIWAGMYFFRHKTKHIKFVLGVPMIFFIQLGIAYKLFFM